MYGNWLDYWDNGSDPISQLKEPPQGEDVRMNKGWIAAIACVVSGAATAQSERDRTFDEIGKSLGEVQRAIANQRLPVSTQMSGGANVLREEVPAYQQPSVSTAPAVVLSPGTSFSVVGQEQGGFVPVAPSSGPLQGRTVYVPSREIQRAGISDYISGQAIEQALAAIKAMAAKVEDNPYVRLKGFKVNVSVTPSVDFDFEMKGPEASAAR
jgi:RNA polymerase-interacting CarD/CdnL/TRCF family regulator